jgi:hypothetical protein
MYGKPILDFIEKNWNNSTKLSHLIDRTILTEDGVFSHHFKKKLEPFSPAEWVEIEVINSKITRIRTFAGLWSNYGYQGTQIFDIKVNSLVDPLTD